ncbi:hypothetical protein [Vibrio tapetis]|uniref:Uncharacterized protein n=1 Tax=Vibrio tapetis subsp. tapetis TaxID=1671868 RepID=A0A2N8ZKD7_9VIBR|nr:hypothetical protein [Vibrio tapetis]SON52336.1 conserved membrane protein of unknown function [Vibrio tapetis subsp. tapetis]
MIKKVMHVLHVLLVMIICVGLSYFAAFRLNEYLTLETMQIQLAANYQIVYVDPTYMIGICGLITMPFLLLFIIWTHILGKDGSGRMGKLLAILLAIGLIFAIPGQIFEHQRQKSIARDHGFVDCPPFTLLSSTHIVEAMVKDPKYCTDDEITSIAMYGYFRELPVVKAYVDEVFGNNSDSI